MHVYIIFPNHFNYYRDSFILSLNTLITHIMGACLANKEMRSEICYSEVKEKDKENL